MAEKLPNFNTVEWGPYRVVDSREVREVQEGATCFCAKKLSKFD